MSRLSEVVTIDKRKVTVNELTVKEVKAIWGELTKEPGKTEQGQLVPFFTNQEFLQKNWSRCVEGLSIAEAEDLAPSELKLIYDAFSKVNAIFFDLALRVEGEDPLLKGFRIAIQADLLNWIGKSAASLNQDTLEPGIMGIASS